MENPSHPAPKSRLLAAFLSLVAPGLGYLYAGKPRRTIATLILLTFFLILYRSPFVLWFGAPGMSGAYIAVVSLWLIHAADSSVQAGSPRPQASYNRWYVYLGYWFSFAVYMTLLTVFLKNFGAAESYRVPANSMAPTVLNGDRIMVNRWAYRNTRPNIGDIAVFRYPKDESVIYIKRVSAGPGDIVEMRANKIFVNSNERSSKTISAPELASTVGEEGLSFTIVMEEVGSARYAVAQSPVSGNAGNFGPITIPAGQYFVLGDNRDRSSDSRTWGFVPLENFLGRAEYIYFSSQPDTGYWRWGRIGKKLE